MKTLRYWGLKGRLTVLRNKGYSYQRIGDLVGMSYNGVKYQLNKTKRLTQKEFNKIVDREERVLAKLKE